MKKFLFVVIVLVIAACNNAVKEKQRHNKRVMKAAPGWDSLGHGIKGIVNALAVYDDELYVAGSFDTAGGKPASGIARWNGTEWKPVGEGIKGNIRALAVYKGELYAAGHFDSAGGKPYSCIAKWNGNAWCDVDTIIDIMAMTVYNDKLFVVGYYDTTTSLIGYNDTTDETTRIGSTDGITSRTIASWNGRCWDEIDNPNINWDIQSLYSYKGTLYAGGVMGYDSSLVQLSDKKWSVFNKVLQFDVAIMQQYRGDLYLAGGDSYQDGNSHIIKWDGDKWSVPDSGLRGQIRSLAVYGNDLYAAGQFAWLNGKFAGCMAKWDGMKWSVVDGGVNLNDVELEKVCPVTNNNLLVYLDSVKVKGDFEYDTLYANIMVNTMLEYNGVLYIGGKFDFAGGVPVKNIAAYKMQAKE